MVANRATESTTTIEARQYATKSVYFFIIVCVREFVSCGGLLLVNVQDFTGPIHPM